MVLPGDHWSSCDVIRASYPCPVPLTRSRACLMMPSVSSPLPLLRLDAFVMGAGTGGCLAGVSLFLRDKGCPAKMYLVDPPGSALFNRVRHGVCYSQQMSERGVKKHRCGHYANQGRQEN